MNYAEKLLEPTIFFKLFKVNKAHFKGNCMGFQKINVFKNPWYDVAGSIRTALSKNAIIWICVCP